jgi:ferredoxin
LTTHPVRFVQGDAEWNVDVEPGTSLLDAARICDAPVQTLCNGIAACMQCKVRIIEGGESLSSPEALEKDRIGNIFHITGERLGCQAKVSGPVVVEVLPVRLPKRDRRPRVPPQRKKRR